MDCNNYCVTATNLPGARDQLECGLMEIHGQPPRFLLRGEIEDAGFIGVQSQRSEADTLN
jgi:hypothetical protein